MAGWQGKLIESTLQHFKDETKIKWVLEEAADGRRRRKDLRPGRPGISLINHPAASAPATGGPGPPAENPDTASRPPTAQLRQAPTPPPPPTHNEMIHHLLAQQQGLRQSLPPPPRKGKLIDDVTADRKFFPESCVVSSNRSCPPEVDGRRQEPRCFQAPTAAGIFAVSATSRRNVPHGERKTALNVARPGRHQDASHTRPRASTHKHWLLSVSLIPAPPLVPSLSNGMKGCINGVRQRER